MSQVISGSRVLPLSELAERAERAAAGFASLGVGPGDAVALYLRNGFAFFEAAIAAGQLGGYPVPINWHYGPEETAYILENCGAKALVIHADLLPGVARALPDGLPVLVAETPGEVAAAYGVPPGAVHVPPGETDWDAFVSRFERRAPEVTDPPGAMIYTSGTTGRPKGVKRNPPTADQALATTRMLARAFGMPNVLPGAAPEQITTVITGPMYHSAPFAYGSMAVRAGAAVILQPRFDPEDLLKLIERHRVTHLHMVPTMFVRLLKLPEAVRAKYDLSSLEFVVHAAAPCPPDVKRGMIEWWGPVINEYYGSTEVGSVVFCTAQEWLDHPGTVGRPQPDVSLKILGEDGRELPPGEIGDVYVRLRTGSDFTYHGDEEKRRRAERDGLITAGDVGYVDADGFLYLCDRRNHMIISGGVNIYPAEIENELVKMPGVADCAVFGIPDADYGEAVCAVVQKQPGATISADDVRAHLRGHLAGYKVPKVVEFQAELPREDSGKIFKRRLRDPYWAGSGRSI